MPVRLRKELSVSIPINTLHNNLDCLLEAAISALSFSRLYYNLPDQDPLRKYLMAPSHP